MINRIAYGLPGHEYEFCVNFEEYDGRLTSGMLGIEHWNYIPERLSDQIQKALEDYDFFVMNRGTRIEITPPLNMWKNMRLGDCEFVFDIIKGLWPDISWLTEALL